MRVIQICYMQIILRVVIRCKMSLFVFEIKLFAQWRYINVFTDNKSELNKNELEQFYFLTETLLSDRVKD